MKKTINTVSFLVLIIFLFSCSQNHNSKSVTENSTSSYEISSIDLAAHADELSQSMVDGKMSETSAPSGKIETFTNFIASHAASAWNNEKTHKLIRSAQMKFKVSTVPQATFEIEDIILRNGGLILSSSINNSKSYSTTINISKDSALVTHYSDLAANIQLKVPQSELDTVLRQIAPLAIEIDYRTIQARDVTLQIMSDSLKQKRMEKKTNHITNAIDNKGKGSRLNDVMDAEGTLDNSLEQVDQTILSTFSLNEQIEFSTIDINLYQNQIKYTEKVLREKQVNGYKSSLASQALDSLINGWQLVSIVFIFALNIWPILLIIAIVVLAYMKYNRRKKDSN